MIYSGLEFAQYFEMAANPQCDDVMKAVQPASRMLFIFFQMYFIFLNAKVVQLFFLINLIGHLTNQIISIQINIIKKSNILLARFGMMHIVATNLCVWLNVIIEETKHEIFHFEQHESGHHQKSVGHGIKKFIIYLFKKNQCSNFQHNGMPTICYR